MKLSQELRLRGAAVGDVYAYTINGDPSPCTYRVRNSEFLENLLLGLYDEDQNFLWVVDKNGNKKKKEIIK